MATEVRKFGINLIFAGHGRADARSDYDAGVLSSGAARDQPHDD
jgi:hypothetical protein